MRDSPCQVFLGAGHRAVQKPRPWDERDEQETGLCWRLFAALQITIFAQNSVAVDVGINGSGRVEQQVLVISPCRGIPEINWLCRPAATMQLSSRGIRIAHST